MFLGRKIQTTKAIESEGRIATSSDWWSRAGKAIDGDRHNYRAKATRSVNPETSMSGEQIKLGNFAIAIILASVIIVLGGGVAGAA